MTFSSTKYSLFLLFGMVLLAGCAKEVSLPVELEINAVETLPLRQAASDTCASERVMMIANCDSALWIIDSITADNPLLNPLLASYQGLENWLRIDSTWRDGNGRAGTWWLDSTETKITYDYTSGLVVEGEIICLNDSIFITYLEFVGIPSTTYMTKAW